MEGERIYCAEQIRIPPELPQVLRDWAKAVVRAQPADLIAFSAKHFAKNAAVSKDNFAVSRFVPEVAQLHKLRAALPETPEPSLAMSEMEKCGVPAPVAEAVLRIIESAGGEIRRIYVVSLLIALAVPTSLGVVRLYIAAAAEDSFRPRVTAAQLIELLRALARFDPKLTPQVLETAEREIGRWIAERGNDVLVSFAMVQESLLGTLLQ